MRLLTFPSLLSKLLCFLASCLLGMTAEEPKRQDVVGTIDFFGLRKVSENDVRAALKLKEGDPFVRGEIRNLVAALQKIPGVEKATVAGITVSGSAALKVFIGIQETGATGFVLHAAPTGDVRLPKELAQIYQDFSAALGPAVRRGNAIETHTEGHALNADPEMRKAEDAAIARLKTDEAVVREVLRSSSNGPDRAAAAWLLGYAPDKKTITADLVAAARDPDSLVRNNATRALGIIAQFAATWPKRGIVIEPEMFVDMLHSVTWTDRNKVSFLLDGMTTSNATALLRTLQERAMPELVEMARWKSGGHAIPAIRILGRIAGWKDEDSSRAGRNGEVEKLIAAAMAVK